MVSRAGIETDAERRRGQCDLAREAQLRAGARGQVLPLHGRHRCLAQAEVVHQVLDVVPGKHALDGKAVADLH